MSLQKRAFEKQKIKYWKWSRSPPFACHATISQKPISLSVQISSKLFPSPGPMRWCQIYSFNYVWNVFISKMCKQLTGQHLLRQVRLPSSRNTSDIAQYHVRHKTWFRPSISKQGSVVQWLSIACLLKPTSWVRFPVVAIFFLAVIFFSLAAHFFNY